MKKHLKVDEEIKVLKIRLNYYTDPKDKIDMLLNTKRIWNKSYENSGILQRMRLKSKIQELNIKITNLIKIVEQEIDYSTTSENDLFIPYNLPEPKQKKWCFPCRETPYIV